MAADFLFNDLLPVGGAYEVSALAFIGRGVQLYDYQRLESAERVQEIFDEQMRYGRLFYATPFMLVHVDGIHKLVDGQHRLASLKQLIDHPDMIGLKIRVIVHLCGSDRALAERIYLQCNNQYMINGAIDRSTNQLFKPDTATLSREVVTKIGTLFPRQIGCRYPNFDLNALEEELNQSKLLETKTVDDVINLIVQANRTFSQLLLLSNHRDYLRCKEKGGFFLPAKVARCRWIRDLQ